MLILQVASTRQQIGNVEVDNRGKIGPRPLVAQDRSSKADRRRCCRRGSKKKVCWCNCGIRQLVYPSARPGRRSKPLTDADARKVADLQHVAQKKIQRAIQVDGPPHPRIDTEDHMEATLPAARRECGRDHRSPRSDRGRKSIAKT